MQKRIASIRSNAYITADKDTMPQMYIMLVEKGFCNPHSHVSIAYHSNFNHLSNWSISVKPSVDRQTLETRPISNPKPSARQIPNAAYPQTFHGLLCHDVSVHNTCYLCQLARISPPSVDNYFFQSCSNSSTASSYWTTCSLSLRIIYLTAAPSSSDASKVARSARRRLREQFISLPKRIEYCDNRASLTPRRKSFSIPIVPQVTTSSSGSAASEFGISRRQYGWHNESCRLEQTRYGGDLHSAGSYDWCCTKGAAISKPSSHWWCMVAVDDHGDFNLPAKMLLTDVLDRVS